MDMGTSLEFEDEKDLITRYDAHFRLTDMNTSKSAMDNMNLLGSKMKYPEAKPMQSSILVKQQQ